MGRWPLGPFQQQKITAAERKKDNCCRIFSMLYGTLGHPSRLRLARCTFQPWSPKPVTNVDHLFDDALLRTHHICDCFWEPVEAVQWGSGDSFLVAGASFLQ